MTVELKWTPRVVADEQKVYRDVVPFAKDALPSPLATIAAGASTYLDTTAPVGDVYYRVSAVLGAQEVVSDIVLAKVEAGGYVPPAGHRYWRVNCYSNQCGLGVAISIAKLEFRESVGGSNVATGGTPTAEGTSGGFVVGNAFDGNSATFWSYDTAGPAWVAYDFGSGNEVDIQEIAITARTGGAYAQAPACGYVEYSDDGSTWTKAWPFAALNQTSDGATETFEKPTVAPTSHEHWRLGLGGSHAADAGNYPLSLTEIELRATVGGSDQTTGATAAASDAFSGTYAASKAIDNNGSSFWASGGGNVYHWFTVDFGSGNDKAVTEIELTARPDGFAPQYPYGISLWFSDDGTTWSLYDCWSEGPGTISASDTFEYEATYEA